VKASVTSRRVTEPLVDLGEEGAPRHPAMLFRVLRFCRCYVFAATLFLFTNRRRLTTSALCYAFGYAFTFLKPCPNKEILTDNG
jgi:hypothetical protein